jgi:protein gp37
MASKIDWCDKTWNPLAGCSPVSPGCDRCYSARLLATRLKHLPDFKGLTKVRADIPGRIVDRLRWTGEVRLLPHKLEQPLHWRKPRRIFVVDKGDLFHPSVPDEYIAAVFGIMAACPQHTFLVLTKRPARMVEWYRWVEKRELAGRELFPWDPPEWRIWQMLYVEARRRSVPPPHHGGAWPLPNVHVGVTAEDQERADERMEQLGQVPAAVHWLSYEPGLGPLQLRDEWLAWLRWVVIGCESGPRARPFRRSWARSMARQCKRAGVPCFTKQLPAEHNGCGRLVKSAELAELGWPVEYPR